MLTTILLGTLSLAQAQDTGSWGTKPFIRPEAGISSWSSGGTTATAVDLGAQAGVRFWQKKADDPSIQGLTRVRGSYLLGTASGVDVRVGAFAGPAWKNIRLQTGPDVYWNRYDWGAVELDPTLGLAWPVQAFSRLGPLGLTIGAQPSFFLSSDRRSVDWSEQSVPGIGDECTYFATAAIQAASLRLSISLTQTITAYGTQRGLGVGFRL